MSCGSLLQSQFPERGHTATCSDQAQRPDQWSMICWPMFGKDTGRRHRGRSAWRRNTAPQEVDTAPIIAWLIGMVKLRKYLQYVNSVYTCRFGKIYLLFFIQYWLHQRLASGFTRGASKTGTAGTGAVVECHTVTWSNIADRFSRAFFLHTTCALQDTK